MASLALRTLQEQLRLNVGIRHPFSFPFSFSFRRSLIWAHTLKVRRFKVSAPGSPTEGERKACMIQASCTGAARRAFRLIMSQLKRMFSFLGQYLIKVNRMKARMKRNEIISIWVDSVRLVLAENGHHYGTSFMLFIELVLELVPKEAAFIMKIRLHAICRNWTNERDRTSSNDQRVPFKSSKV